jgi:hypothetical protein
VSRAGTVSNKSFISLNLYYCTCSRNDRRNNIIKCCRLNFMGVCMFMSMHVLREYTEH